MRIKIVLVLAPCEPFWFLLEVNVDNIEWNPLSQQYQHGPLSIWTEPHVVHRHLNNTEWNPLSQKYQHGPLH
jgi:hypothetical protein